MRDHWRGWRVSAGLCQPRPSDINRVNMEVEVAWDEDLPGVPRPFWICPRCSKRCRFIYVAQTACRQCSGLDWSCRHRNRTIPNYNRVLYLRRKLGAELAPFTPLPTFPRQATRKRQIAAEIGRLEAGLVRHLANINNVLSRRLRLRGLK